MNQKFQKSFEKTFEKTIDIFCSSPKLLSPVIADINIMALNYIKELLEKNEVLEDYLKDVIIQTSSQIMDEINEEYKKIYIIERDIIFKSKYKIKLTFLCELKYPGWIYSTYNIIFKIVCDQYRPDI